MTPLWIAAAAATALAIWLGYNLVQYRAYAPGFSHDCMNRPIAGPPHPTEQEFCDCLGADIAAQLTYWDYLWLDEGSQDFRGIYVPVLDKCMALYRGET